MHCRRMRGRRVQWSLRIPHWSHSRAQRAPPHAGNAACATTLTALLAIHFARQGHNSGLSLRPSSLLSTPCLCELIWLALLSTEVSRATGFLRERHYHGRHSDNTAVGGMGGAAKARTAHGRPDEEATPATRGPFQSWSGCKRPELAT